MVWKNMENIMFVDVVAEENIFADVVHENRFCSCSS